MTNSFPNFDQALSNLNNAITVFGTTFSTTLRQLGGDMDTDHPEYYAWRERNPGMISTDQATRVAMSDFGYSYLDAEERYQLAMRALVDATECGLIPRPNVPLLRKGLEWVEWSNARKEAGDAFDGEAFWDQSTWRAIYPKHEWDEEAEGVRVTSYAAKDCKTAMCFAGYTADVAGVQWHDPKDDGDHSVVPVTGKLAGAYPEVVNKLRDQGAVKTDTYGRDGRLYDYIEISDFAREVLGLTVQEAGQLFAGNNSVYDIRRTVAVIAERAGERI